MAKKTFTGRPVQPGELSRIATVSHQAFNTSASYFENMYEDGLVEVG